MNQCIPWLDVQLPRKCRMPAKNPDLEPKDLRAALKLWDNVSALGSHPFASWNLVEKQRNRIGYEDTLAGRGLALRDLLRLGVEALAPEAEEPAREERRWRPYLILKARYLEGRTPGQIAEQLAIARSTYNHEQLRAEKALLAKLIEWEERGSTDQAVETMVHGVPEQHRGRPFMAPQRQPKGLVGREELLGNLRERLISGLDGAKIGLSGLPGVGKTAIAVELAHDTNVREAYPDGVLWLGFGQSPNLFVLLHLLASALDLQSDFLTTLEAFEDRARVVHAGIGDRRMLLVLDDLWQAEHALAFQLGGPACATIYTTRAPAILHALPEVDNYEVQELDSIESLELLEHYAPSVVQVRRELLEQAVAQIGGLPITLVLIGGFLRREAYAGQPRRLSKALKDLRDIERWGEIGGAVSPLDQRPGMEIGEELSLFRVIAMSVEILGRGAQRMLRALACFPPKPATFPESLALASSGESSDDLDELVDAGLVEAAGDDRYRIHGAIRQYAATKSEDSEIFYRFVEAVTTYMKDHAADPLRFALEVPVIQGAMVLAEQEELVSAWIQIAHHFFHYLNRVGLYQQAISVLTPAHEAAENEGELSDELMLSNDLGTAYQRLGEYATAREYYKRSRRLAEDLGQTDAICAALQGLGAAAFSQGEFDKANQVYQEGLSLAKESELLHRQAGLLSNLGTLAVSKGELDEARIFYEHGLILAQEGDDPNLMSALLSNLGTIQARLGDLEVAEVSFSSGLEYAENSGDRSAVVALLTNLGTLAHERGQGAQAKKYLYQALEQAREIGDLARVCQVLANLGALAGEARDREQAVTYIKEGLSIAESIGHREHQILLLINLSELYKSEGKEEESAQVLFRAKEIARSIDHARYLRIIEGIQVGASDEVVSE